MEPISWGSYLLICFLVALVYYGVLALQGFRRKMNGRAGTVWQPAASRSTRQDEPAGDEPFNAATGAPVHALVDELQAYIKQSGQEKVAAAQLYQGIQVILDKYPTMAGSVYQEGITNLIAVTVEQECAIHYSAEELSRLWKKE